MNDRPLRILSLDGGGAWAVLQVMALRDLYGPDVRGRRLLSHFDIVPATSGGAMVLMGLVEDKTLGEIEETFCDATQRARVFRKLPFWRKWLRLGAVFRLVGLGSRYSSEGKLQGLRDLAEMTREFYLDELPVKLGPLPQLLITSFDYDRERAVIFRSHPAHQPTVRPRLHEAVHASSSAPVKFFDQAAVIDGMRFWDGAIGGNNNPAMVGVIEAFASRPDVPRDRIELLTLGTGSIRVLHPEPPPPGPVSTLVDIKKMALSVLDDPPDAATYNAHVVLGLPVPRSAGECVPGTRVVRLNPELRYVKDSGGRPAMPEGLSRAEFARLQKIDMDAADPADFALVRRFGELWLRGGVPNQPIRASRSFECEVGHDDYASARAAWLQRMPAI